MFDLTEIISATMILFAVIDIIGSIPIILVCGLNCLKTLIAPEINPPPPIGIKR